VRDLLLNVLLGAVGTLRSSYLLHVGQGSDQIVDGNEVSPDAVTVDLRRMRR
jgi:hypothetical protein